MSAVQSGSIVMPGFGSPMVSLLRGCERLDWRDIDSISCGQMRDTAAWEALRGHGRPVKAGRVEDRKSGSKGRGFWGSVRGGRRVADRRSGAHTTPARLA